MIRSLLAVLLLLCACADIPDEVPATISDQDTVEIEKKEQATQAWLLPTAVYVRAKPVSATNVIWSASSEYFGKYYDDLPNKRGY